MKLKLFKTIAKAVVAVGTVVGTEYVIPGAVGQVIQAVAVIATLLSRSPLDEK